MKKQNRDLLHSLTCVQFDRVFRFRPEPFTRATYHLLTADELKQKFNGAIRASRRALLMPPIVPIDGDKIEVIAKDPELQGIIKNKFIFIDTTFAQKDRDRTIFVRQPNGVLETADQLTRRRMLQTYFPLKGRRLVVPQMFIGDDFERVLNEGKYEFVLNRCIIQFEPYEKDYHRITSRTYQHIYDHNAFDSIRSTRHFGPMAFFLAWHKLIDNLIIDCVRRDYLRNAVEAICLMFNLNNIPYDLYILEQLKRYPKRDDEYFYRKAIESRTSDALLKIDIEKTAGKNADDFKTDEACLEFLDAFCKSEHTNKSNEIRAALQTYREEAEEKRKLLEGLQKAHGLN